MDFVRNRQFRQTLLCHASARPTRALTPEFMRGLMVSSRSEADTPSPELTAGTSVVFAIGLQQRLGAFTAPMRASDITDLRHVP